ncbi:MAG: permease [Acidimicrobiales bacterium]
MDRFPDVAHGDSAPPIPGPLTAASGDVGAGEVTGPDGPTTRRARLIALGAFLLIAAVGTYLVKWHPYYLKGFSVATDHTLGASMVSGHSGAAPAGWHAALDYAYHYGASIWQAFVVGLLVAAGIQELLPRDWLMRLLGQGRFRSTAIAGMAAVPSMMCTCCSAAPTVTLARSRASVGATMAYWLGNPVLNPATIVFMALVLGWRWAVLRIVVGVVLVLGLASLAQHIFGERDLPLAAEKAVAAAASRPTDDRPLGVRYFSTLGRLCLGLVPEYLVIVVGLGAARAFLFPAVTPAIGHALWLVVVLAITGTLFVIPTAGEIPIVQTFMGFGLGTAGAAALMITLPAVSLPSLVMVGRAVPAKVLALVASMVVAMGLVTAGAAVALGV